MKNRPLNVEAFEARQTDGEEKYNSTNLYQ